MDREDDGVVVVMVVIVVMVVMVVVVAMSFVHGAYRWMERERLLARCILVFDNMQWEVRAALLRRSSGHYYCKEAGR